MIKKEWVEASLLEKSSNELPTFEQLNNYRGARDIDLMKVWCTYFFPAVIGTCSFKKKLKKCRLSAILSVSDEAFVLTVIENYYDRWKEEAVLKAENKEIIVKNLSKPKWTDTKSGSQ